MLVFIKYRAGRSVPQYGNITADLNPINDAPSPTDIRSTHHQIVLLNFIFLRGTTTTF